MWLLVLAMVCAVAAVVWAALGIADTQYDDAVHQAAQQPGGDR
jgi:hypothetical protein